MRICLAGDTHGNLDHTKRVFNRAAGEADVIFQLGDYGYGWQWIDYPDCLVDWFTWEVSRLAADFGMLFYWIPGNHENYDALYGLLDTLTPEANGTYQIAPNVYYVPRGLILEFGSKKFLCCGGATSVDKTYRQEGISWWPQEAITESDVSKCANAGEADVLLSHDFPWECNIIDRHLSPYWGDEAQINVEKSRRKISIIAANAKVKRVFHGHLHIYYSEMIELNGQRVHVRGLNCDGTPLNESTLLIDTEDL